MTKTPKPKPTGRFDWMVAAAGMRDNFCLDLTPTESEILEAVAASGNLGAVIDALDLILTRRRKKPHNRNRGDKKGRPHARNR
jgi:hypothetical protein